MPTHNVYGSWPRSGEIDVMETQGNEHFEHTNGEPVSIPPDGFSKTSTLHFGPDGRSSAWRTAHFTCEMEDRWGWHLYQLEWTPGRLQIIERFMLHFNFVICIIVFCE